MQPLQGDLHQQVANTHASTHMTTEDGNNHTAIALRSATTCFKTPFKSARANAPKAAWSFLTARQKKHQNDRCCNRRRGTLHCRQQPLYTKKHNASLCGVRPNTSLMQHSCCHPTAICNPRFKRPQQDPKKHQNERPATAVNTGCPSSPTAATSTELFRALASFPAQVPCNNRAAITMRSAPLPEANTSLSRHFSKSSVPSVTTSRSHKHFPKIRVILVVFSCIFVFFLKFWAVNEKSNKKEEVQTRITNIFHVFLPWTLPQHNKRGFTINNLEVECKRPTQT